MKRETDPRERLRILGEARTYHFANFRFTK